MPLAGRGLLGVGAWRCPGSHKNSMVVRMGVKILWSFVLLLLLVRVSHALEARDFHRIPPGEGRVALVIGNNHYVHANGLQNAVADAAAMKEKLAGLGFDVVYRTDASRKEMNKAIDSFAMKLSMNAVGMVFYSGHGIQINGENYLIPVDLDAQEESDVVNDGVNLAKILGQMSGAQAKFSLVVLDACRDNPFRYAHIGGKGMASTRGLAPISSNARGIMVVYSAGSGQKALDRLGDKDESPNGLFTREFLKVMERPGVKIQELVDEVRERVIAQAESVGQTQTPAVYNESKGTFFFLLPADQKVTVTVEPKGDGGNASPSELEDRKQAADREDQRTFWQSAHDDPAICQDYLNRWPNGLYVVPAKRCIEKGDDAKRQAEAARLAEAEQQRRVAENEQRLAATEERRKAEEARLAELKRQREEVELRAQTAAAPQPAARQSLEPEMVSIPAGTFMMGSPPSEKDRQPAEKQHRVKVAAFSMGKYAVTVGEFRRFVQATNYKTEAESSGAGCFAHDDDDKEPWKYRAWASWKKPNKYQGNQDNHPVTCVSWNDAEAYARWLSQETGKQYRLPTEAEWEYAARAGTTTSRFWGDDPNDACAYANVADETKLPNGSQWSPRHECNDGHAFVAGVGSYQANPWGLYDMLGNVWQWTCSVHDEDYSGSERRCSGKKDANLRRSLRGGSWYNAPLGLRAADRDGNNPDNRNFNIGFRLVQD